MNNLTKNLNAPVTPVKRNGKFWSYSPFIAALLFCLSVAFGYFLIQSSFADDPDNNENLESILEPNLEHNPSPRVLVLPSTEFSEPSAKEKPEKVKTASKPNDETVKTIKAAEIVDDETEKTSETVFTRERVSIPPPVTKPQPRNRNKKREDSSPEIRIIVPDIESVFTGRSYESRNKKVRYEREEKEKDDERRGRMKDAAGRRKNIAHN